jgi:hypothetical protein
MNCCLNWIHNTNEEQKLLKIYSYPEAFTPRIRLSNSKYNIDWAGAIRARPTGVRKGSKIIEP